MAAAWAHPPNFGQGAAPFARVVGNRMRAARNRLFLPPPFKARLPG